MGDLHFQCAICQRDIDLLWNHRGPGETIPPVCTYCESQYARPSAAPTAGSMRDRRSVMQIAALAEALRCEAARQTWPASWRAPYAEA